MTKRIRATHNTTAEGIRFAHELGGIPNPSLAIHRADCPFDSMGEISLVAPLALVDPARPDVGVYDADIFSTRTPERRFETTPDTYSLIREIEAEAKRLLGPHASTMGADDLNKGIDPVDVARRLAHDVVGCALFLRSACGVAVEPVPGLPCYLSPAFDTEEVQAFFDSLDRPWTKVMYGDPDYVRYSAAVRAGLSRQFKEMGESDDVPRLLSYYFDEKGLLHYGKSIYVKHDLELRTLGYAVDGTATRERIEHLLGEHGGMTAAEAWWRERIRKTYRSPYFLDARGRKVAFTLENVSKEMSRATDPRAREETLAFGPGNARAALARRLRSMTEVLEQGDKLVSREELDAWRNRQDEARPTLVELLQPSHPLHDHHNRTTVTWDVLDDIHRALVHLGRQRHVTLEAAHTALKNVGFLEVDEKQTSAFLDYAKLVLEAPTQYFEAKLKRPVELREFFGAIVPDDAPADVLDILREHGLEIETYPCRDAIERMRAFDRFCDGNQEAQAGLGITVLSCPPPAQKPGVTGRRSRS